MKKHTVLVLLLLFGSGVFWIFGASMLFMAFSTDLFSGVVALLGGGFILVGVFLMNAASNISRRGA